MPRGSCYRGLASAPLSVEPSRERVPSDVVPDSSVATAPTTGTETSGMRPDGNGKGIALSSAYLIGGQLCMRGIGLISTVILVRLLSPQDFGIAALATTIYVILDTLTATGFNMALIRMSDPTREHYDTAWTLGIIRGVIIALALVATAGLQSRLMHEPRIAPVMWVIGAQAVVMSFANIRLVDYERNMRFHILAWWMISGRLLLLAIGLIMLIFMRNYWVLILATFATRVITLPAGYVIAPYRPRLSLAGWRDLFHFSKWLFLGNLCVVSDSQLMNFVVGHFLGLSQVGFYQVGNQIAALPISELAAPIRRPVYAGLSRVKDQVAAMRRVFLSGMAAQAAIVFPLTLGVVLTAPEIVRLFLGAKWVPLTWVLPVIAAYQLCNAVGEYVHVLLIVSNRQRLYALTYYITIALRIPLTIWGAVHWGLFGAAMAMLVSAMWNAAIWTAQVNRIIGLPWWSELASCWRTLISGGIMSIVVLLATGPLRGMPALDVPVRLALESLIGGITYFAAHTLLWLSSGMPEESPEAYVMRHLRRFITPRVPQLGLPLQ